MGWFSVITGVAGLGLDIASGIIGREQAEQEAAIAAQQYRQTVEKNQRLIKGLVIAVVVVILFILVVKYRKK